MAKSEKIIPERRKHDHARKKQYGKKIICTPVQPSSPAARTLSPAKPSQYAAQHQPIYCPAPAKSRNTNRFKIREDVRYDLKQLAH